MPEGHVDVTLACLNRGVPVLGEKPMTATLAEARELIEASERTGVLFAVSQSSRYHPGITALRGLVADHTGAPELVSCQFFRAPRFGGFRDEMPSPLVHDMAIHTFDAARWVIGSDPVSVFCDEFNPSWSWYRGDACASAIFEFANGARFTYAGGWCTDGLETSWECQWRVTGPFGTAVWDGTDPPFAEIRAEADGALRSVAGAQDESAPLGIRGALAEFIAALDGGAPPLGECHDNIKSLAMCIAAEQSAATNARVAIEQA